MQIAECKANRTQSVGGFGNPVNFLYTLLFKRVKELDDSYFYIDPLSYKVPVCHIIIVLDLIFVFSDCQNCITVFGHVNVSFIIIYKFPDN